MTVEVTATHPRAAMKCAVNAPSMNSVPVARDRHGAARVMASTGRTARCSPRPAIATKRCFRFDRETWSPTEMKSRLPSRRSSRFPRAASGR